MIQEAHPTKLTVDAKSILRKSSPREDGTGGGAGGASSEDKSQETSPVPQKLTTSNDLEDESSSPKGGTASSLKFGDLRTSGRKVCVATSSSEKHNSQPTSLFSYPRELYF